MRVRFLKGSSHIGFKARDIDHHVSLQITKYNTEDANHSQNISYLVTWRYVAYIDVEYVYPQQCQEGSSAPSNPDETRACLLSCHFSLQASVARQCRGPAFVPWLSAGVSSKTMLWACFRAMALYKRQEQENGGRTAVELWYQKRISNFQNIMYQGT